MEGKIIEKIIQEGWKLPQKSEIKCLIASSSNEEKGNTAGKRPISLQEHLFEM